VSVPVWHGRPSALIPASRGRLSYTHRRSKAPNDVARWGSPFGAVICRYGFD
jgi:hypothetical protein